MSVTPHNCIGFSWLLDGQNVSMVGIYFRKHNSILGGKYTCLLVCMPLTNSLRRKNSLRDFKSCSKDFKISMIVASYTIKIGNNLEIYCNLWLSLMILKISDVRFPKKLPKISRAATD